MLKLSSAVFSLLFAAQPLAACTTFMISQSPEKIMGKSYDWRHHDGLVLVNKRNTLKTALAPSRRANPARWTSKFGSVTFNQHGREFPVSGVNEAGLAVEIMWLGVSAFPPPDARPEINEVQWVQYQLDNFSSVGELVNHLNDIRVSRFFAPVHYLACDQTGACAAIEFIGGKPVVRAGPDVIALANDAYDDSASFRKDFAGFGGSLPIPKDGGSLGRFVRASSLARNYAPGGPLGAVEYAFGVLTSLAQTGGEITSQWSIVYSLAASRVDFRLAGSGALMTVDLAGLDFSCAKPTQALDLGAGLSGDVTGRFVDYDREMNRKIVELGLKGARTTLDPAIVDAIAAYPETFRCAAPPALQSSGSGRALLNLPAVFE